VIVRVLGAHTLESRSTRHTCFLIDGVLALDAGSLCSALTPKEQLGVAAVLLTHRHYDHVRDLPTLGLATRDQGQPVDVYSLPETLEEVFGRLMDGTLYPDFTRSADGPRGPKYRPHPVRPGEAFPVRGYWVLPVEVFHGPPAVGYVVTDPRGRSFAYTGDLGLGLLPFCQAAPDLLAVDISFPNRMVRWAEDSGHLTPALLRDELAIARERGYPVPPVIAVHMNRHLPKKIEAELRQVAEELGVEILIGREDQTFDL